MSAKKLPKGMVSALHGLIKENDQELRAAINLIIPVLNETLFVEDLDSLLESHDIPRGSKISRELVRVSGFFYSNGISIDEALEQYARSKDDFDGDSSAIEEFIKLAFDEHVVTAYKIFALSYRDDRILRKSSVIVDARPVFDGSRNEIVAFSILSQLSIDYAEGGDQESLTFALDKEDVQKLKKTCEDALLKIDLLSSRLLENEKIPVYQRGVSESVADSKPKRHN